MELMGGAHKEGKKVRLKHWIKREKKKKEELNDVTKEGDKSSNKNSYLEPK